MGTSGVFSTSEGYHEYIGGIPSAHRRDTMSTSGGYHEYIGDVQYIGGIMIHVGGYHEYIRGCSVHRGYHEYIGGIS